MQCLPAGGVRLLTLMDADDGQQRRAGCSPCVCGPCKEKIKSAGGINPLALLRPGRPALPPSLTMQPRSANANTTGALLVVAGCAPIRVRACLLVLRIVRYVCRLWPRREERAATSRRGGRQAAGHAPLAATMHKRRLRLSSLLPSPRNVSASSPTRPPPPTTLIFSPTREARTYITGKGRQPGAAAAAVASLLAVRSCVCACA